MTPIELFIVTILGLSLVLYAVFGGADYGAGMVEIALTPDCRREKEEIITRALGPVWEVNHIWLILAVVILFTAFPAIYSALSITFHIPLTIMLVGIVLRGSAFAFRHYDPFPDVRATYSLIFRASSVLVPFSQGVIVGACILGDVPASSSFADLYLYPWLTWFPISVGIFLCALCHLLAAAFLTAETKEPPIQNEFTRLAKRAVIAAVVAGGVVFLAAELSGSRLMARFADSWVGIAAVVFASAGVLLLWLALRRRRFYAARFTAAGVVGCVTAGLLGVSFPFVLGGHAEASLNLSLLDSLAPPATLNHLAVALIVGLILVLPALAFLFFTFKSERTRAATMVSALMMASTIIPAAYAEESPLRSQLEALSSTVSGPKWNGMIESVNDAGLLIRPDQEKLAIAVFISESRSSAEEQAAVIAGAAKAAAGSL